MWNIAESRLAGRLRDGEPLLGTFTFLQSPAAAEAVASAGVDVVVIDMEHAAPDWSEVANTIRAIEVGGAAAMVRVPGGDPSGVLRTLELGAQGIVVPFVRGPEDVARAVASVRYPPAGRRGTCSMTRAASYGLRRAAFQELTEQANEGVVLVGIIEDQEGFRNVDAILDADPGLDVVLLGRGDLATDMGLPGQTEHPDVVQLVEHALEKALAHERVVPGVVAYDMAQIPAWRARGVPLVFYAADVVVLARAFADAVQAFGQAAAAPRTAAAAS
jgi:2-keto-3-deoxy-L-rhamnonate aldolase RhmA